MNTKNICILIIILFSSVCSADFGQGTFEVVLMKWGTGTNDVGGRNENIFSFPGRGPSSITVSPSGEIYVLDSINLKVIKLNGDGDYQGVLPYITGLEKPVFASDIAVNDTGEIYLIAPYESELIRIYRNRPEEIFSGAELPDGARLQEIAIGNGSELLVMDTENQILLLMNYNGDLLSGVRDPDISAVSDDEGNIYASRISTDNLLILYRWNRTLGVTERIAEMSSINEGWLFYSSQVLKANKDGSVLMLVREESEEDDGITIQERNVLLLISSEGELISNKVDFLNPGMKEALSKGKYAPEPGGRSVIIGEIVSSGYRLRRLSL